MSLLYSEEDTDKPTPIAAPPQISEVSRCTTADVERVAGWNRDSHAGATEQE